MYCFNLDRPLKAIIPSSMDCDELWRHCDWNRSFILCINWRNLYSLSYLGSPRFGAVELSLRCSASLSFFKRFTGIIWAMAGTRNNGSLDQYNSVLGRSCNPIPVRIPRKAFISSSFVSFQCFSRFCHAYRLVWNTSNWMTSSSTKWLKNSIGFSLPSIGIAGNTWILSKFTRVLFSCLFPHRVSSASLSVRVKWGKLDTLSFYCLIKNYDLALSAKLITL